MEKNVLQGGPKNSNFDFKKFTFSAPFNMATATQPRPNCQIYQLCFFLSSVLNCLRGETRKCKYNIILGWFAKAFFFRDITLNCGKWRFFLIEIYSFRDTTTNDRSLLQNFFRRIEWYIWFCHMTDFQSSFSHFQSFLVIFQPIFVILSNLSN